MSSIGPNIYGDKPVYVNGQFTGYYRDRRAKANYKLDEAGGKRIYDNGTETALNGTPLPPGPATQVQIPTTPESLPGSAGFYDPATGKFKLPQQAEAAPVGYTPGTAPTQNVFKPTASQQGGNITGVANSAAGGTIQNFNRAAGRLRERIEGMAGGARQQSQDSFLGRGFGNSGAAQMAQRGIGRDAMSAYGQGLVDLENNFEGHRQQGLQTALNSFLGLQQNEQSMNALNQLESSQNKSALNEIYKNTEANKLDAAKANATNQLDASKTNSANLKDMVMQLNELIATLQLGNAGNLINLTDLLGK